MIFAIIIGIVALFFIVGLFQKKVQQKEFRKNIQLNGGFRSYFPNLTKMLEDDLNMSLVSDTGDNFFYQCDLKHNEYVIGKFRVGRKIDYSKNNLLYTELITDFGDKKDGLPICFEDDKPKEGYKELIKKSYSKIFENDSPKLDNIVFFNYFKTSVNQIEEIIENKSFAIKEFFYYYEGGEIKKELRSIKAYTNDKLSKSEHFDSNSGILSTNEKEEFFYKDELINYSILDNIFFINKNWHYYNDKKMLTQIETDSLHKEFQSTVRFTSKIITYNHKNLILEEKNMSSSGEVFSAYINEYDDSGNNITEIINEKYSFKKYLNKFNDENKLIEQVIYNQKKSLFPSETIFYEYDDPNNIIKKTLKYSSYSFLTIQYYDNKNRIIKEDSYNTENKHTGTVNYIYDDTMLVKVENIRDSQVTAWTEFKYEQL